MMKFFKKHWEVLSYLIFGVLTTLLNIVLYALFSRLFGYEAANSWGNVLDNVICILFAYVTNRAFVFASRTQGREALKEFGAFVTCRLGTLVLDAAIVMIFGNLLAAQGAALVESFMNGALSLLAGWFGPDTVLHMATGGAAPAPSISDGSAAIAIIGGADGPTSILVASHHWRRRWPHRHLCHQLLRCPGPVGHGGEGVLQRGGGRAELCVQQAHRF